MPGRTIYFQLAIKALFRESPMDFPRSFEKKEKNGILLNRMKLKEFHEV